MGFYRGIKGFCLVVAGVGVLAIGGCSGGDKKVEVSNNSTTAQAPAEGAPEATPAQAPAEATKGASPVATESGKIPEGHPAVDSMAKQDMHAGIPAQAPQGPAHGNIKGAQKEVRLTDAVRAKFNEVKLDVIDSSSKATEILTVKVGSSVELKAKGYKINVEAFVPDYSISGNSIESRSDTLRNPAVLVELTHAGKGVAKGWVFKNFPDFNSYNDARFKVKLVGP